MRWRFSWRGWSRNLAVKKHSAWWKLHQMQRILRCVPRDCRPEVREVLNALDPDNPIAALLWLVREHKVEILNRRHAMEKGA